MSMTVEQAKSELMQIYGMLSPDKQRAIDTLVKIEPCEDAIPRTTAITLVNDVQTNGGFSDYKYYEYLYDHLSTMPSVNPQPKTDCNKCVYSTKNGECQYDDIAETIPTEQEPKTGHWRAVYQGDEIIDYRCSECEFGNTFGKGTYGMNYCPNCGCHMVEQERSDKE